jgi:hypothetical protein
MVFHSRSTPATASLRLTNPALGASVNFASCWPMHQIPDQGCRMRWPVRLEEPSRWDGIYPPGSLNGWIKVETLEGIYRQLAQPSATPRILCGDFNAPKAELADGRVVTSVECIQPDGQIVPDTSLGTRVRWDWAVRSVHSVLAEYDLRDVYGKLHGYSTQDGSWFFGCWVSGSCSMNLG